MRSKAVENARAKAIALIKPLNQHIRKAIQIISGIPQTPASALQGKLSGIIMTGYAKRVVDREQVPKIAFEKISISADVNVNFILE